MAGVKADDGLKPIIKEVSDVKTNHLKASLLETIHKTNRLKTSYFKTSQFEGRVADVLHVGCGFKVARVVVTVVLRWTFQGTGCKVAGFQVADAGLKPIIKRVSHFNQPP